MTDGEPPPAEAWKSPGFRPRRTTGRRIYGAVILLLVVGGGLLQFQWMQGAGKTEVAPNSMFEKIGMWMLHQRGIPADEVAGDSAGAEKMACQACMGTGVVLGETGGRTMCPICLGLGFHMIKRFDASDRICPLCAGMGRVALPDTGVIGTCPRCEGRGLVRSQAAASAAAAGK